MAKTATPVAATIFDAAGVLAWIVAGVAFFREETMPMVVSSGGLGLDVTSIQLLHSQMSQLVLWCSFAIIGTLFFGFGAMLKRVPAPSEKPSSENP